MHNKLVRRAKRSTGKHENVPLCLSFSLVSYETLIQNSWNCCFQQLSMSISMLLDITAAKDSFVDEDNKSDQI